MGTHVHVHELGRDELDAATLARLARVLRASAFVAIDTEMGGVACRDSPRPSVMDSIDERYAQYRESATQFPLVQFGLAIFSWDADAQRFHVETYQFPLFPVYQEERRPTGSAARATAASPDRRFLVQAKCLQYIRAHGFDLNVWIDRGIGHLSHQEQEQEPWRSVLAQAARPERLTTGEPDHAALVTSETQAFLDHVTEKVKQRLAAFDAAPRRACENDTKEPASRRRGRSADRDERDRVTLRGSVVRSEVCMGNEQVSDQDEQDAVKEEDNDDEDSVDDSDPRQEELEETPETNRLESEADLVVTMKHFLESPVSSIDPTCGPCGTYVTEPLAPFRRHALVQHLRKVLPDLVALECNVDNADDDDVGRHPWKRRVRLVSARSACQQQALVRADQALADDARLARNVTLVGFTAVLDALVAAGKPLVGHNVLLDLMQCYEKFHRPLPARCAAFQRDLHAWIGARGGSVFDTKVLVDYAMQTVDSFGTHVVHSALEHCYQVVSKHPFYGPDVQSVEPSLHGPASAHDDGQGTASSSRAPLQAHQAGYDAFMTGFVFLRVCAGLGVSNACLGALGTSSSATTPLERFRNALFVSHFVPTCVLRLPGPYPEPTPTPSRARFVRMHLTRTTTRSTSSSSSRTSPVVKTFHIKQCVGRALHLASATRRVTVYWEGPDCVYVELPSVQAAAQLVRVRSQTQACWASASDALPSIGCVDLEPCSEPPTTCPASDATTKTTMTVAPTTPSPSRDDETRRRKRKSSDRMA